MSALTGLSSTLSSGINDVQSKMATVQTELATGKKQLDPGQLGEVTRLASQVTGYNSAANNICQAQNAISVAQTGLSSINDLMTQLTDLANKASNASLSDTDRTNLNSTFQSLLGQIDKIAGTTEVNGVNLLSSSAVNSTIQAGITSTDVATIHATKTDTTSLGISSTATKASVFAAYTAAGGRDSAVINYANLSTGTLAQLNTAISAADTNATAALTGTVTIDMATLAANEAAAHTAATAANSASGIDITTAASAQTAVTRLALALNTVSSNQSSLAADAAGLTAKASTDTAIATNLQSTIDSIQKPDQAALQMQLTQLNNQQSVDYYLISQLNTASQAALTIFR